MVDTLIALIERGLKDAPKARPDLRLIDCAALTLPRKADASPRKPPMKTRKYSRT